LCLSLVGVSLPAQDIQFLPKIDAHLTLNSYMRAYLQAKDDREGGDPEQFTFGPSIQFYLKPLIKLQKVTVFDLDDAKSRPLVIESGYRIIIAPNTANENRAIEAVTVHVPLVAGFQAYGWSRCSEIVAWTNTQVRLSTSAQNPSYSRTVGCSSRSESRGDWFLC
jgi:hypothetical protein